MMGRPRLTARPPIAYTPWSERRARALASGACVRCGQPATRPGVSAHCAGCVALLDEARLERMDGHRAHGRCACGQPPRPGARTCGECYQPRAVVRPAEQAAIDKGQS